MKKLIIICVLLTACHDTRSYENVRKIKTGMKINEIEYFMGSPFGYDRINDSTESRVYLFDNVGNGIDMQVRVVYQNEISVLIK